MIKIDDLDETQCIMLGGKRYCAYCGKEIKVTERIYGDDYNPDYRYICNCEDAQKEMDVKYKIYFMKRDELPEAKFCVGEAILPIKKKY